MLSERLNAVKSGVPSTETSASLGGVGEGEGSFGSGSPPEPRTLPTPPTERTQVELGTPAAPVFWTEPDAPTAQEGIPDTPEALAGYLLRRYRVVTAQQWYMLYTFASVRWAVEAMEIVAQEPGAVKRPAGFILHLLRLKAQAMQGVRER
jgi:hypothetical protein